MASPIVDPNAQNSGSEGEASDTSSPTLVSWIKSRVDDWEDHRNTNYSKRWDEYYRLWRGKWSAEDKNRQVERSKIIAPALQQAIEAGVAEIEESIFHRKRWFDFDDDALERYAQRPDASQEGLQEMQQTVDKLLEDMERKHVQQSMAEMLLNGALYGTGIGKLVVSVDKERLPVPFANVPQVLEKERVGVSLVPVDPREFVIDPAAKSIDDASGVAHIYEVPLHEVLKKQANDVYLSGFVGTYDPNSEDPKDPEMTQNHKKWDKVEITEYHGLVPKRMLKEAQKEPESEEDLILQSLSSSDVPEPDDSADLVEAIVWIANRSVLLRVSPNPFIMQDRSFVAFQYDTVPNKFWGRGIGEKGYNPQKGLDAELRARIDSLALATYPMLVINGTMAPRGQDYSVRPGRNLVVQGAPGEAMAPFKFPPPDPQTYRQTAEMERMVTVATGAIDTAAPLGINPRNETASGMSMMLSSVLKRTKRTLRNIEHQFLTPLLHKMTWRYLQFDPERYPTQDYRFKVISGLGAQAREFEVAQLTQLIQTQAPESPGYWIILRGILRNYNVEDKELLMDIIDAQLQNSLNPQEKQPEIKDLVAMRKQDLEERKQQFREDAEVEEQVRKDVATEAEAVRDRGEQIWNSSEAVLNIAKAETERVKALGALVQQMASAAGTEGADLQSILSQADAIVDASASDARNTPELESLQTSMLRQQEEELEPGFFGLDET